MCVIDLIGLQNNNLLVVFVSEFMKLVFIDQIKSIRWEFALLSSACFKKSRTVYEKRECSRRGKTRGFHPRFFLRRG